MLVILGNSAHLNPFLLQKGFFSRTESRRHHLAGSDISKCAFSYQRRYRFVFSHCCLLGVKTSQKCTVWTQIFFLENSFMQKSLRVRGATVKFRKPRGLYFSKVLFERFIFGGAYVRSGLSMEGNLRFKIDWAGPIVERKFTVFALFEGKFWKYKSPGGLYLEGRLNGGFFALRLWGAYFWRGLFSEFYSI